MTNVLLIEDHALLRQYLPSLLSAEDQIFVVGTAESGYAGLTLARQLCFDVVLVDISLPDLSGLEVIKRLRQQYPERTIIAWSLYDEGDYGEYARASGASTYVCKTAPLATLVTLLQNVPAIPC